MLHLWPQWHTWLHPSIFFFWRRLVRHPWRSDGEALLPEVHGRLHPQIFQASPHRWSLFWNRVPPHVVHGAPRVSSKATSQPVCAKVCWIWCYFLALTLANANMPLNIEMHFNIYFEHFIITFYIFLFQAIWFQNSPNGLSTPTSGCIKFQEPREDNSLELYVNKSRGLLMVVYYLFEAMDYITPVNACTVSPPLCW